MDYRKLEPVGKCKICGINLWAEHNNEPAIWPCGISDCPYPPKDTVRIERSAVGSSLNLPFYES